MDWTIHFMSSPEECSRAKILSSTSKKSNSESSKTTTQEPLKGLRYQQPQPKKSEVSEV